MGVLGLWQILESVGHPIKIDGLEGKRLGVDANIWLYKFIRGFREKDNASSIDSHKLGLFNRICKLLFYKIKPVFVFDGPAPVLKRRTLERRQNVRNKNLTKMQTTAARLLAEHLREQYPGMDVKEVAIRLPEFRSNNLAAAEKLTDEDRNLFYLPPPDPKQEAISSSDDEVEFEDGEVDVNSEDFKKLPPEIRYEILKDKKQTRRHRRPDSLPDDASDFSNLQLRRLKARRDIQEKIEECEKEICGSYTGEMTFRIQSDPSKFMIYTKQQKKEPETKPDQEKKQDFVASFVNKPKLERKYESKQELVSFPEKVSESSPKPEKDSHSDPKLGIVLEKEPDLYIESATESESESEPHPEPGPAPKPELSPEPDSELEQEARPDPELEPATEIEIEPEPDKKSESETESATETETEIELDMELRPEPENELEKDLEPECEQERQTNSELVLEEELDSEPELKTDKRSETILISDDEPEPVILSEVEPKMRAERQEPEVEIVRGTELEVESSRSVQPRETNRVTAKIVEEAKELLRLFGIPYIDAAGEAEAQCALLESLNLTEGTITDDSDIWLFGAKNVYRYFFSDDKWVMQYKMPDIEFHLRMNRENLVCFAMLVGSDYTDGIMNVGPVTALEILSEFQGEELSPLMKYKDFVDEYRSQPANDKRITGTDIKKRKRLLKYDLPDEFPSRAVFEGYMRPVADTSSEEFSWGLPDLDQLREYARRNFGWEPKRIDDKLLPVMKKLSEKRTQPTIDSYFFKTAASQNPELFRSKRVNEALKKISNKESTTTTIASASPSKTTTTTSNKRERTRRAPRKSAKGKATTKRGSKKSNQPVPEVVCLSETDSEEFIEC